MIDESVEPSIAVSMIAARKRWAVAEIFAAGVAASHATIAWNSYALLRACDVFFCEGEEHDGGPREVATWTLRWCSGEATSADVINAVATLPILTSFSTPWAHMHDAARRVAEMAIGKCQSNNAVVVRVQTALEQLYRSDGWTRAEAITTAWSREWDAMTSPFAASV